jgi:hypothetical protein
LAFEGRPITEDDDDDGMALLGAMMVAEDQAVNIRKAEAWFAVKKAEAKASKEAERKNKSAHKFRSSR